MTAEKTVLGSVRSFAGSGVAVAVRMKQAAPFVGDARLEETIRSAKPVRRRTKQVAR
jgi:hypothetical protein